MKEKRRRGRPSKGSNKLSDFYGRRAEEYRALLRFLSSPITDEDPPEIVDLALGPQPTDAPRPSLEAGARHPPISLTTSTQCRRCADTAIDRKIAAYVKDEPAVSFVGAKALHVLASLSEHTAEAIKGGDLLLASDLADLHRAHAEAHADGCLGELISQLANATSPLYSDLAIWLRRTIQEGLAGVGESPSADANQLLSRAGTLH